MKLTLSRIQFTERSTIGDLLEDNELWICFVLEDKVRPNGVKIPGKTAIPEGTYQIIINESKRFKRLMPLLLNVPGFEGIRIHSGNVDADTEGCLLVGLSRAPDYVGQSKAAFGVVFSIIKEAIDAGEEVWITILESKLSQHKEVI